MIGKKINQLATELAPQSTDLTIIGDPISGVSKKITLAQLGAIFSGAVSFYTDLASFPVSGDINVIYCAKDTQKLYLWTGSAYVEVFPSQALLDTYQLRSEKGNANGYASLDSLGKVPISQLPSSIMEYKGTWNAATNTPTLANGTGDTGDVYICNVAGTVNFGAGPISFAVGDYVIYSGTIWQRSSGAVGTVTSVAASITGNSVSISGSPIVTSGTLAFSFAGNATQYVRGDGQLATLPTNGGGGGASVSYYLNGSINQGTIGGVTYYEMNKTPIIGAGTDFTRNSNGYIASFLTDANDPALLNIPAGNFNFETYFEASSGGGSPTFYIELYKYDGTNFTLIASNSTSPKLINDATNIEAYFSALAVPQTTLTLTDRLAIRIYVTTAGRTITLHTENNTLCQVITTFTTGLTALNGLTAQVQYLATGTSGTDFNIASASATHTFNLPTASATNRGALSSTDWTTFNNKQNALTNPITGISASGRVAYFNGDTSITGSSNFFWDATNNRLGIGLNNPQRTLEIHNATADSQLRISGAAPSVSLGEAITGAIYQAKFGLITANGQYVTGGVAGDFVMISQTGATIFATSSTEKMRISSGGNVGIGETNPTSRLHIQSSASGGQNLRIQTSVAAGRNYIQFANGSGDMGYIGYGGADSKFWINNQLNDDMLFVNNGATRLTIASTGAATFSSSVTANSTINGYFGGITTGQSPASSGTSPNNPMLSLTNNRGVGLYVGGQHASPFGIWLQVSDTSNLGTNYPLLLQPNGGNVGIGTINPSYRLVVNSGTDGISAGISGSTYGIRFDNGGTFSSGMSTIHGVDATLIGSYQPIMINGSDVRFGTSATERARITSGGVLKIGNGGTADDGLNPGYKNVAISFNNAQNRGEIQAVQQGLLVYPLVLNGAGGNVGIGTYNPTSLFHIEKSSNSGSGSAFPRINVVNSLGTQGDGSSTFNFADIRISAGNGAVDMFLGTTFASGTWAPAAIINVATNHDLQFKTNNSTRMTITSGGNVLMGKTTTGAVLNNGFEFNPSTNYISTCTSVSADTAAYISNTGTSGTRFLVRFYGTSSEVGRITHDGTNTSYVTSSDYRLKEDLKSYNGLDLIGNIKTYDYQWKYNKERMYGVLAHELAEVLPYAVSGIKDGEIMQGVDYSKIVPVLIKAIQELNNKIK